MTIIIKTHTVRKVKPIDKNSTLGEQIKYYRRLADIEQTELAQRIGCCRYTIGSIENYKSKFIDVDLIKRVLDELEIKDKVKINDDYIKFLLDNPSETITNFRKERSLTRKELADMVGVYISSIRAWELGITTITRKKFDILKRCMS
ncbi:MAG: helix-turn-helix domain-containing protein [Oscillospiraceae bacterium]|nr:helix-turn-helix domain-containing protein [Oscillospiraceae bacterium]